MSECEQLKEHYESYALGALEGEERAEIDAHLARECPVCTPEVERARWVVAHLAYAAPEASPPASLRAKVLQATRQPRRAWMPVWAWAGAAALLLFSVFTAYRTRELQGQLAALQTHIRQEQQRSRELESERQRYQQVFAILSAAGTRETSLKPSVVTLPEVRAYWHEQLGLVLTAQHMPAPAADRTFQLWVVPKKGNPISAGIFRPDATGQLLLVSAPEAKIAEAAALAISDEPAGGRPQPTRDKILWVGPLT